MSLIETAIDKAKDLAKLAQKLDNIEIIQRVLDVQGELLKVQEEVGALRKENEDFKNVEKIDGELIQRDRAYWHDAAPESRRGPFCLKCWDADRKKVSLVVRGDGVMTCHNCNGTYHTQAYENEAAAARAERSSQRMRSNPWG